MGTITVGGHFVKISFFESHIYLYFLKIWGYGNVAARAFTCVDSETLWSLESDFLVSQRFSVRLPCGLLAVIHSEVMGTSTRFSVR